MALVIHEDLITGEGTGIDGPERPANLVGVPLSRLRWSGGSVIDVAGVTTWHIDSAGRKLSLIHI